jgi:WD40 repeat protein
MASELTVWEVGTGRKVRSFNQPGRATSVGFSPDGNRIVSAAIIDGWLLTLLASPTRTGGLVAAPLGQGPLLASCAAAAIENDELPAALFTDQGAIRVWDLPTGAHLLTMTPPAQPTAVLFSPDGQSVVSATTVPY